VCAFAAGRPLRAHLKSLLRKKEIVGELCDQLRTGRSRHLHHRATGLESGDAEGGGNGSSNSEALFADEGWLEEQLAGLLRVMRRLDEDIGPLIARDGEHFSKRWGYLSITGERRCQVSCAAWLRIHFALSSLGLQLQTGISYSPALLRTRASDGMVSTGGI
jgi:hypothetical protein